MNVFCRLPTSLTLLTEAYNSDRSQPSYISSAGFLRTFKTLLSRFYSLDFHFSRPTLRRMDGRQLATVQRARRVALL